VPTRYRIALAATLATLLSGSASAQMGNPNQPDRTLTAGERTQVIEALGKVLKDRYVFPDVGQRLDARLQERLAAKAYDTLTSAKAFSRILTDDLAAIAHDKHLRVFYSSEPMQPRGAGPRPTGPDPFASLNYGFQKVERMPGNVGYLRLDAFADPQGAAGEIAVAAMSFLAGTDALIVDVRQNGGGSPGMVALLCSYFFEGRPVHLNSLYWRIPDQTQQWWTLAYVPGKRYANRDIYVLTSTRTFSAAEEFTYNLKTQKRATIVGDTTGGGANPGGTERLSDYFGAFVPSGRAINPITKTNWEGTGVSPDIPVAADRALDTAYREALTKLVAKTRNPMVDRETKEALDKLSRGS